MHSRGRTLPSAPEVMLIILLPTTEKGDLPIHRKVSSKEGTIPAKQRRTDCLRKRSEKEENEEVVHGESSGGEQALNSKDINRALPGMTKARGTRSWDFRVACLMRVPNYPGKILSAAVCQFVAPPNLLNNSCSERRT